ncbi:MAG TPA: NAD-dependent epimerase/dehydratase family protein [Thermoleophilaceae bacterium]|nr:NAD-dependent epimerase/dehydratase family protein [Actinomycetota bacterium]HYN50894.1 NAD-dependent epimerase/dehydratase family protein [Thermoleophilaceae bacterium]
MRYVITGGAGYIGSRLVDFLSRREDTEKIVVCDVASPQGYVPKTEFERVDVRDRDGVRATLERAKPDALVHLAFILNPSHDEALMYDVDVNGTHNVLEAAAAAGTHQVLVTSSSSAYGAFPDNPVPLTEEDPVRGVSAFSYARDKTESDRICQLWAAKYPERTMTIVRPCIVFGPNVDNYLVRLWTKQPFAADPGTIDNDIQFVHEDDVVEAITALLVGRNAGAFNVAGDGLMTPRECAEMIGSPIRRLPLRAYRGLARTMWHVRLSEAPPGSIDFTLYPWIVSNEKLKRETGWSPRHTTRETFEITMRAHGKLPPNGDPAGERTAATLQNA